MSANRVMRNISRFIEEKLGLKVNMTKSKVDRPSGLKYLGFGFYFDSVVFSIVSKCTCEADNGFLNLIPCIVFSYCLS